MAGHQASSCPSAIWNSTIHDRLFWCLLFPVSNMSSNVIPLFGPFCWIPPCLAVAVLKMIWKALQDPANLLNLLLTLVFSPLSQHQLHHGSLFLSYLFPPSENLPTAITAKDAIIMSFIISYLLIFQKHVPHPSVADPSANLLRAPEFSILALC